SLCRWEQYASGERVIAAGGDWQKSLCIIAAGEAQISLRDNVIQTLGKGQCFGEMVLYSNDPPNFSVAAINNVRAFCIGKESFDSLSMECIQAFYCGIARALDERLSAVMRLYEVNPN
ncbi:MAG: cyclic nucleotide-binding domain-containing protein, partial [Candidatus Eutrophobiaceae bacterium]